MKKLLCVVLLLISMFTLAGCKKAVEKLNEEDLGIFLMIAAAGDENKFVEAGTIKVKSIGEYDYIKSGGASVAWVSLEMEYIDNEGDAREGKFLIIETISGSAPKYGVYEYETGCSLLEVFNVRLGSYEAKEHDVKNINKALKDYYK